MDSYRRVTMRSGRWFQSLPDDVRQAVEQAATLRQPRAGSRLFSAGDSNSGMHCLLDGVVHIIGFTKAGTEVLMTILYPGDWTGFLANLDRGKHAFTAICMTDCTVATLTPRAVESIFEVDVARYKLLLKPELIISRRNYLYLLEYHGGPPLQRLAYRLLDLARGPYGVPNQPVTTTVHVSQEQLGTASQLSRQKVNTLLNKLAELGLVHVSRNLITILDADGLDQISRGGT